VFTEGLNEKKKRNLDEYVNLNYLRNMIHLSF